MKRNFSQMLLLLLITVLSLGLIACANTNQTSGESGSSNNNEGETVEKVTIKVADPNPTSHPNNKVVTQWINRIEELGNGKIEVEHFPAEQMGKAASLLSTVKNKVADVGLLISPYYGDVMPLSGIPGNPGLVSDIVSGSKAYNKLITEDLYELEFKPNGIKPLWAAVTSPNQIVTSNSAVKTVENFKGLKITTPGGVLEQVMQKWGATPVTLTGADIYNAWDRGTVEGAVIGFTSIPSYQLDKLAKFSSTNASLSSFGFYLVVNEEIWSSWPKEVQDAVQQASNEAVEMFTNTLLDIESKVIEDLKEKNIELYELSEKELKELNHSLQPFNDKWISDMDARGLPAAEIMEKFVQYIGEFEGEEGQ